MSQIIGVLGTLDSDVLRWIAQADDPRGESRKKKEKKWKYSINSWLGQKREGEWIPAPVATNTKRSFRHFAKSKTEKDDRGKPLIISVETEELIYMHHGYRPRFTDENDTRKSFYYRGARVWRT